VAKLPVPLRFDWDQGNIEKNWQKHEVHFKEAEEVFFNKPLIILEDTKHPQMEGRFIALGITNKNRNLYVVFTIRSDKVSKAFPRIRIISARDQSKSERRLYAEKEV